MRITFVSPAGTLSGGCRVIAIYARLLRERGHDVTVVAMAQDVRPTLKERLFGMPGPRPQPPSHFDTEQVPVRVIYGKDHIDDGDVPDADVVIATWWTTIEWVHALPARKGKKVHFCQGHEAFSYLPVDRVQSAYRLPLHKIVVARCLADLMRDSYGIDGADVVPNSVDQQLFHASPRRKQQHSTIGLMYAAAYWKRFNLALQVVERVRKNLPALRVLCFGSEEPASPLPDFITFSLKPPQRSLRDIYADCDVWLTASSDEGFNLPAMEAMACRTPVVATQTGWPAEAVVTGMNGASVPVDDLEGLARETEALLRLSETDWQAMSQRAYETVRNSSWEQSAELFDRALERVLERSPRFDVPSARPT